MFTWSNFSQTQVSSTPLEDGPWPVPLAKKLVGSKTSKKTNLCFLCLCSAAITLNLELFRDFLQCVWGGTPFQLISEHLRLTRHFLFGSNERLSSVQKNSGHMFHVFQQARIEKSILGWSVYQCVLDYIYLSIWNSTWHLILSKQIPDIKRNLGLLLLKSEVLPIIYTNHLPKYCAFLSNSRLFLFWLC